VYLPRTVSPTQKIYAPSSEVNVSDPHIRDLDLRCASEREFNLHRTKRVFRRAPPA
jgi:hypothetical protein